MINVPYLRELLQSCSERWFRLELLIQFNIFYIPVSMTSINFEVGPLTFR